VKSTAAARFVIFRKECSIQTVLCFTVRVVPECVSGVSTVLVSSGLNWFMRNPKTFKKHAAQVKVQENISVKLMFGLEPETESV